jgi:fatty-acyl-CoA synthase
VLKAERKDTTATQIVEWSRERMAAFKVPRIVQFVDALPRTATGKVFWRKLQEEENRK